MLKEQELKFKRHGQRDYCEPSLMATVILFRKAQTRKPPAISILE